MSEQDNTADNTVTDTTGTVDTLEVDTTDARTTDVDTADVDTADVGTADVGTADVDTTDVDTAAPTESDTAAVDRDADTASAESQDQPEAGSDEDGQAPSKRVNQLEREGEVAADFLETLLDIADLDGDLDVDVDGDRAAVAIVDSDEGRVPRRLIGHDGEVLESLQELTRLAVQSATGERSRLMLDVGGHRAARREALVVRAQQAVDAVAASGEREELEPMTAFERKVVHDAVLAAGLSSESEGTEPNRFVVVVPA